MSTFLLLVGVSLAALIAVLGLVAATVRVSEVHFAHSNDEDGSDTDGEFEDDAPEPTLSGEVSLECLEIISNADLREIQTVGTQKGILHASDVVVVMAQEFLDHDILFDIVKDNIRQSVRYLYLLDREHIRSFQQLLNRLYSSLRDEEVNDGIDVIFLKPTLTLNNFVQMSAETDRAAMFSALIAGDRPVHWLRQDHSRAAHFVRQAKKIIRRLAMRQYVAATNDDGVDEYDYFFLSDQIMDFSPLGRRIIEAGYSHEDIDQFQFRLADFVAISPLPADSMSKVISLGSANPASRST